MTRQDELIFIVHDPQNVHSKNRVVRSHVTRLQWKKYKYGEQNMGSRTQRRRREEFLPLTVTLDCSKLPSQTDASASDRRDCSLTQFCSGTRVDPFRSYPIAWQPFIPALVDHYIVAMAVDVPELDQPGHRGLLRTRWFPTVLAEPALFLVILLLAASHYASMHESADMKVDLLRLRYQAVQSINQLLHDPNKPLDDGIVGAVAKMASYEAMFGSIENYHLHMRGLMRIIAQRGGLASLGLGGLLRRIVIWIDHNSAFLNGTTLYYPEEKLAEPNPGHFLGAA